MKFKLSVHSKHFFSILLLIFVSCSQFNNFTLPKSVSVKTEAELVFPLGQIDASQIDLDISDKFSSSAMQSLIADSLGDSIKVYDYIPDENDDSIQYLLHYEPFSLPLDISSYLSDLNIDDMLNSNDLGFSFSQSIPLPSLSVNEKIELFDLSQLQDSFIELTRDALTSAGGTIQSFPEPGKDSHGNPIEIHATDYLVGLENEDYSHITTELRFGQSIIYSPGSAILVTFTRTDTCELSSDFHFTLSAKITSLDENTNYGTPAQLTDIRDGGTIALSLEGTLPAQMKILIDGTVSGGELDFLNPTKHLHSYSISLALSDQTHVDKITGVTATPEQLGLDVVPSINQTLSVKDAAGYFTSAVIGEGQIRIRCPMPEGWYGVHCNTDIQINGAGFNNVTVEDSVQAPIMFVDKYLNLANQTFAPTEDDDEISITGNVSLEIQNATIAFTTTEKTEIQVLCDIQKLAQATIDFTTDKYRALPLTYSLPQSGENAVPVANELLQYVRQISFPEYKHSATGAITVEKGNGFGLRCKLKNTFPQGNNIPIKFKSNFFNFLKNVELKGYNDTGLHESENWTTYTTVHLPAYQEGIVHYIDFSATLPDTVTFVNLEMGKTYEIGLSDTELIYDWDSIQFDTSSTNLSGFIDISFMSVDSLIENMELPVSSEDFRKINFASLPLYLYISAPQDSFLGNISLTGNLQIAYDKLEDNQLRPHALNLLDTDSDGFSDPLHFVEPYTWPSVTTLTQNVETITDYSSKVDFAEIMNSNPQNMEINYDLMLYSSQGSQITIYSKQFEQALSDENVPMEISIGFSFILPFAFKLNGAIGLEIMNYVKENWLTDTTIDLFDRESSEPSETSIEEYLDLIDYIKISCECTNNIFKLSDENGDTALSFVIDDRGENRSGIYSRFNSKRNYIEITREDIRSILNSPVFHPFLKLQLGKENSTTDFVLSRNIFNLPSQSNLLSAKVNLDVKMNGKGQLEIWRANE